MSFPSAAAVPGERIASPGQPGRREARTSARRQLAHRRLLLRRALRRTARAARHRARRLCDLPRAQQLATASARASSTPSTTIASRRRSSTSSSSWPSGSSARRSSSSALTLMLHNLAQRVGAAFRFLFYIPGALAGAASVIVWLFMLDPSASPFAFVLHWLGYAQFDNAIAPGNLPADLRDHGFLDRRRWVDRRHVRRAQQHPARADRVGPDRRRERIQDRVLRSSCR